jgi:hypothetical protein
MRTRRLHYTNGPKREREKRGKVLARFYFHLCVLMRECGSGGAGCLPLMHFHHWISLWAERKLVEPPAVSKFVGIKKICNTGAKVAPFACDSVLSLPVSVASALLLAHFLAAQSRSSPAAAPVFIDWAADCYGTQFVKLHLNWCERMEGSFARAAFGLRCFNAHVLWQLASRV